MKSTTNYFSGYSIRLFIFLLAPMAIFSQTPQTVILDNFEGNKSIRYTERTGVLDSLAKNPKVDSVNKSQKCALYVRNGAKKFDNVKMELPGKLADINLYATYLGIPPKLKMKIYTSAPPGTLVEILLGNKLGNNDYPAGTNSQYQAYTTVSDAWEQLEFKFSQIPQGSETSTSQIDQLTLLFNPNSSNSDTYYFDDITGPTFTDQKTTQVETPPNVTQKPEAPKKVSTSKKGATTKKITGK